MTRPILQTPAGFAAPVIDKVERLLEILGALRDDPSLAGTCGCWTGNRGSIRVCFSHRGPKSRRGPCATP